MSDGSFGDRLGALHKQRQQSYGGRFESVAGRMLSSAVGVQSFSRKQRLARQSTRYGRDRPAVRTVSSIFSYLASLWLQFYHRLVEELKSFSSPFKAGLAAAICSLICYVPGPLSFASKNGNWAVITADICLGANVGLTVSKGISRTLGTLAASILALAVDFVAPKFGEYESYFMVFCVFWGGALPTMFKFRPPFNDRWNYAVVMSTITFHILILSSSSYADKIKLPEIRLVTILIGFLTALLVSLIIAPQYAGKRINNLVGKNFERAGNMMERCVIAYCEGMVLEHVSDIRAGLSEDDNIHSSIHEIVVADDEAGRLLEAVPYEPPHGKFFCGYPWGIYEDITHDLRLALFDILALDSCLRAEIQAPLHLRNIFEEEFQCIGKELAQVFRMIGESIGQMRHVYCLHRISKAEEAALLIQHKISKHISAEVGIVSAENEIGGKDLEFHDEMNALLSSEGDFSTPQPPVERLGSNRSKPRLEDGHEDLLRRRESMGRHWDTTVQRISVLSLLKFASILIELVAKAKYVVTMVDELEIKARFDKDDEGQYAANTLATSDSQQV